MPWRHASLLAKWCLSPASKLEVLIGWKNPARSEHQNMTNQLTVHQIPVGPRTDT